MAKFLEHQEKQNIQNQNTNLNGVSDMPAIVGKKPNSKKGKRIAANNEVDESPKKRRKGTKSNAKPDEKNNQIGTNDVENEPKSEKLQISQVGRDLSLHILPSSSTNSNFIGENNGNNRGLIMTNVGGLQPYNEGDFNNSKHAHNRGFSSKTAGHRNSNNLADMSSMGLVKKDSFVEMESMMIPKPPTVASLTVERYTSDDNSESFESDEE